MKRLLKPHETQWHKNLSTGTEAWLAENYDEAIVLLERAIQLAIEKRLSADQILHSYFPLGCALRDSEKFDEALSVFKRAIEFGKRSGPEDQLIHAMLYIESGMLLFEKHNFADGQVHLEKAVEIERLIKVPMTPELLAVRFALALCCALNGDLKKAAETGRAALAASIRLHGPGHQVTRNFKALINGIHGNLVS